MLRTDDLQGALWIPGDGKANPADLAQSLAKGARNRGVKIVEGVEVTGVHRRERRVAVPACEDERRAIALRDRSSTAPANGRAQFGALAGVNVPLYSAEHFYIVTGRSPACIRCCR